MPVELVNAKALDRLNKLPSAVVQANKKAVERAAFAMKTSVQRQRGFTSRLRGVGRSGARVGVRYDVRGVKNPTAIVRATGPFHLIESDTKAHEIAPRSRRRGGGKRAVFTPYGPKARVQHPGTKGRHPFARGVEASLPAVRKIMGSAMTSSIRGVLVGGGRF